MNYNAYGDFRFPRRSNSAQDIVRMRKIRNPYIETDRNTEHLVLMNREQTNILNQTVQIDKENFETVKILLNQIKENKVSADKQFKFSAVIALLAAPFISVLIQKLLNYVLWF